MSISQQLDLCLRMAIATALSALIGFERERNGHAAGLRTHMLVGMGAALFTVLSLYAFAPGDPGRVAAQIVVGISFLGAGTIIQRSNSRSRGLTTAAGIWAVAAIGMTCGAALYIVAVFATALTWFVLAIVARLSSRIRRRTRGNNTIKVQNSE